MPAHEVIEQLRKLAALRDDGVIDAVEFARLKAELLAQDAGTGGSGLATSDLAGLPAAGAPAVPPNDDLCVTPSQVAESQRRLATIEQEVGQLGQAQQERLARLRSAEKRATHYSFLQTARRISRGIAWGRFTPVMIATALGLLLGVILFGILPLPTGLVMAGGLLTAGGMLLASLHVFAVPRDEAVAEQLAASQKAAAEIQSQIPAAEATLDAAKAALDQAKQQHSALIERFESRLNQILLFDWRMLRGTPFEKFLASVFEHLGYNVRHVGTSGDQGVDLILEKDEVRIAVQAKGYAENVNNAAVQQVHAGMKYHKCQRCVVVTNSCFTSSAVELAARVNCTLVDGANLKSLILGNIRL